MGIWTTLAECVRDVLLILIGRQALKIWNDFDTARIGFSSIRRDSTHASFGLSAHPNFYCRFLSLVSLPICESYAFSVRR
jgi:hypothetical protein